MLLILSAVAILLVGYLGIVTCILFLIAAALMLRDYRIEQR